MMATNDFKQVKDAYSALREGERRRIIDALAEVKDNNGNPLFSKVKGDYSDARYKYRGGKGNSKYGKTRFGRHYDLSSWKYIETCYRDKYVLISLQCFDIDPSSKNIHVLYDRIGMLFEKSEYIFVEGIKLNNSLIKMEPTNWELPMKDDEIREMIDYIINHFEAMTS